jgi:hypothetical protein
MMFAESTTKCDAAFQDEQAGEEFNAQTRDLFAQIQAFRESDDGIAFRFLPQPGRLEQIAQFIERESACCPFMQFQVTVERKNGPLWLNISGEEGTKEFLLSELEGLQAMEQNHDG